MATFNPLVELLGGTGFTTPQLITPNRPLSVVGVQEALAGTQWQARGALRGSYTVVDDRYAFSPTYYRFDTNPDNSVSMSFPDLPGGPYNPSDVLNAAGLLIVVLDTPRSLRSRAGRSPTAAPASRCRSSRGPAPTRMSCSCRALATSTR